MKMKKIFLEITRDQAVKVLGISQSDANDADKLKAAYRAASMKSHPDRGGSNAAMQDVTAAYELLKKHVGTGGSFDRKSFDDEQKERLELALAALRSLKEKMDVNAFVKHFATIYGQPFQYKLVKESPKENDRIYPYGIMLNYEFYNDDRSIVFTLDFYCSLSDIKYNRSLGSGAKNISYPLMVSAYGFFNNKKLKITKRDYKSTQDHDVLSNPEMSFPAKRLNTFKSTSGDKQFRRQDMVTYLTSKLSLPWDGESARLKLPENITVRFARGVFMRQPYWSLWVYENSKGIPGMPYVNFPETEGTALVFEKLVKDLRGKSSKADILSTLKSELDRLKSKKGTL